jgi:methionyl aminopeptidase
MTEPHPLGVLARSPAEIEAVDPKFLVAGLLAARAKTIEVFARIRRDLTAGMTEDDARKFALDHFRESGVTKHWHKPYIRFGAGTSLTFHEPLQPEYRLRDGDPVSIDLGPAWPDPERGLEYEGDYGDTFVFAGDRVPNPEAERCAESARIIFSETATAWRGRSLDGKAMYAFMLRRARELGYVLREKVDGHRLADFPHQRYAKERLAETPFVPRDSHWVLELQLNDRAGRFGAFFEDILGVDPATGLLYSGSRSS